MELVVSEVDGFIFEGYSGYKHQDRGDDGDKSLEVQHCFSLWATLF
jgi:hypothetical protein